MKMLLSVLMINLKQSLLIIYFNNEKYVFNTIPVKINLDIFIIEALIKEDVQVTSKEGTVPVYRERTCSYKKQNTFTRFIYFIITGWNLSRQLIAIPIVGL